MRKLVTFWNVFCLIFVSSMMFNLLTPINSHAKESRIATEVISSKAGDVKDGKQVIFLKVKVTNIYDIAMNYTILGFNANVYGKFYNAAQGKFLKESYSRKIKIQKKVRLQSGKSTEFTIKFARVVDPQRGKFRYESVKIKITGISYK